MGHLKDPPDPPPTGAVVLRGAEVGALEATARRVLGPRSGRAVVCARLSAPAPASPAVVEAVVDALVEAGASDVVVGTALGTRDRDRGHRAVEHLAAQAGLTGRTARGRRYAVTDLLASTVPSPVPPTGVLHQGAVSALWVAAQTRVVVGRAATDLVDGYAGCLQVLGAVAQEVPGAELADVVREVDQFLPACLAVVDVLEVSAGPDGSHLLDPVRTDAVVVSADTVAADSALAALLGVDRSLSRPVARVLGDRSLTPVTGDCSALGGVTVPHPLAVAAARAAAAHPGVARLLEATVGGPDPDAAPADPVLATLRSLLTPVVAASSTPAGLAALVGLLGAVTSVTRARDTWATTMSKADVPRRVVPLGFDPEELPDHVYDSLPALLAEFDPVVESLPQAGDDAVRWCIVDGATVFETSREIPASFDAFVARVDVAEGISLMADYLGGRRVTVKGTPATRTGVTRTRQAERNLYLAQPNYLAVWGGEPIDVCKVELLERGPDHHRLWWRTVASPNGSAVHDDGSLTFARSATGTRVSVRGRQLFSLPPAWVGVDLALVPEVRDPLLEEAYRRFFTTTFDNLEACFEGRPFRIGRDPATGTEPLMTTTLHLLLDAAQDWLGSPSDGATVATDAPDAVVDVHGFRHVKGRR